MATNRLSRVQLGATGPEIFPIGLGCLGMSGHYGAADDAESLATIQMAVEHGVTLIDTGDFYGVGHNEMLIRRALHGRRDQVQLSVKFGNMRTPDGGWARVDCRPVAVRNFLAYSLTRLGVDHIDIYRPSRLDPEVPIEETIGAIADLIKAGYVRHIGLSEVGVETIRRAHAVHPISDLQIEYSLFSRSPESDIFPVLKELGIGVTAYGVLAQGLLAGSGATGAADFRSYLPRFGGDHYAQNRTLAATLERMAFRRGVRPAQLAIAWVRAQGDQIVPLVGARNRLQLEEALGALSIDLSQDESAAIATALPPDHVRGTRYPAALMEQLDSER